MLYKDIRRLLFHNLCVVSCINCGFIKDFDDDIDDDDDI